MRINTRIVIDIQSLRVTERESVEYTGPIAWCKGGGTSTTTTYDEKYNRRMANISERQQAMSEEYFAFWKQHGKPYEAAKIKANLELMPYEVETAKEEMATKRQGMGLMREEMTAVKPVMEEYYKQALEGVDVGEETTRARADVAQGLQEVEGEMERQMGRLGVDPTSPAYQERMKTSGMEKAKAVGGAMSQARQYAERESFQRVAGATAQFKGGLNL